MDTVTLTDGHRDGKTLTVPEGTETVSIPTQVGAELWLDRYDALTGELIEQHIVGV